MRKRDSYIAYMRSMGVDGKDCPGCGRYLDFSKFGPYDLRHDGMKEKCRECLCIEEKRWRHASPDRMERARAYMRAIPKEKRAAGRRKQREQNPACSLLSTIRVNCRNKGIAYDLHEHQAEINDIILNQGCQLTGMPFDLSSGWTWNSPSVDRIEAGGSYIWTNVRIVLWGINAAMGTWGLDRLMEMTDAIRSRA